MDMFWNVDVQNDFMNKDGALYVPGAESLIHGIISLNSRTRVGGRFMGSVDAHSQTDAELHANGGPFPPHCIKGTNGQLLIPYLTGTLVHSYGKRPGFKILDSKKIFIENKDYTAVELSNLLKNAGRDVDIFFEKQHFDVFTNPNVGLFLNMFKAAGEELEDVYVYGVAIDYCVKAAALGLLNYFEGVYVVSDLVKPVSERDGEAALAEMQSAGVEFIKSSDLFEQVMSRAGIRTEM